MMRSPNGLALNERAAQVNASVNRAAALLSADPEAAALEIEKALKLSPQDPRGLLILGSARRRLGNLEGAKAILGPLAAAYPRAANTQYELGAVLAALGKPAAAVAALRRAIGLNRDLAGAWSVLSDQLFRLGDASGAERAVAEHARASIRDPRLKPVAAAILEGRGDEAEDQLRAFLKSDPHHTEALKMLANLAARAGRYGDAETLLAHALTRTPDADDARFAYASALFRQQKALPALAEVERLLLNDPDNVAFKNLWAGCLSLVGEHDRAADLYREVLATYEKQPSLWLNFGHTLRTIGRRDDAIAAYKRAIALSPGYGEAYWSLANLKVTPFTAEEEAAMAEAARADVSDDDRLHLHYALGKALEDRGAFAESFDHYERGANIRRSQSSYSAEETHALTERTKALFTKAFFDSRAGVGAPSNAPIFIVGLPRAGSTLVEQILASHSEVEGTMELPEINLLAHGLGARGPLGDAPLYPEVLANLSPDGFREMGEDFLARTMVYRKLGRARFIDKMPNNFQHLGFIHLILPNAKIVDARRHPMGSCFSAFKQHFNQGQAFSYDLADLARYYSDYLSLMAHFDAVLPGRIHRVIYEDMVQDTEAEVRQLLDFCELPFEAACLRFFDNDRAVRTVSSEQVRRPIFRTALEQWRHYQPWLGPLESGLGGLLENWRRSEGLTSP